MADQTVKPRPTRKTHHLIHHTGLVRLGLITLLGLMLILVACGPSPTPPTEVRVQNAVPTPTPEPTFTPSPPPTSTPRPSPTATPAEPTPTLTPQSLLSGRIPDQDTHQAVAGATVRVGAAAVSTDADGRYILSGLPPGQYVLSVTHPDYDPGLSSIFTLAAGQELSLDLTLYAPDTSPYPKDPMLTNPLDPDGAPTAEDAERLARLQGLTGEVVNIQETKLSGEYLVNYKIGDEVRAAVAKLNHDVWELTDDAGRAWWIIKVCGNLVSPLPSEVPLATPQPRALPPMAEIVVDGVTVQACASETCAEVGALAQGKQVEVFGCLAGGDWCQVGLPGGGSGWCTGQSLRHLAVAGAVLVVPAVLPTATPGVAVGEGKIAFVSDRDGNEEIYVMNTDGSGQTRLTNHPADDSSPTWSPDNKQIAFMSERDGNSQIYLMNADGSGVTRLANHPADDYHPAWSPDGQKIAFASYDLYSCDIYLMDADGANLTRLSMNLLALEPAWSPNGRQIAFSDKEIYVMSADGSNVTPLTNHSEWDTGPAWSPNGQQIAFTSRRDMNHDIYIMSTDGSGLKRLTNDPNMDFSPAWSLNGQQIAFTSRRDGNDEIYVMNADSSGLTNLTKNPADDSDPAWTR